MSTILEVEKLALALPERQRATLPANLLDSLTGILSEEDEGVAEVLRRDAEIEGDPSQAISLTDLESQIQGRRAENPSESALLNYLVNLVHPVQNSCI